MIYQSARDELRRGWKLILACSLGVGCSAIALPFYSIGPLTKPIEADMAWLRSDVQLAILFSSGIGAITAPATGWLIERVGARVVAIPSLLGVATGLLTASFATSLHEFWAGYALAAILGAGSNPVLWSRVIAGAFEKARGLALGLALTGTAMVAVLIPILVTQMEPLYGWRSALRIIAMLPVIVALPTVYALLRPNDIRSYNGVSVAASGHTVREALRGYRFWVLAGSILAAYLALSGGAPNFLPAFTDLGIAPKTAAFMASLYAFAIVPGRVLSGALMDHFWAPLVAFLVLLLPASACLIIINTSDILLLSIACVMFGLAAGAELDVLAFMIARYFGVAHFSKIYAICYTALAIGSAVAPAIFSRLREATGDYETSFAVAAGLFVLAGLSMLMLGRYPVLTLRTKEAA